MNKPLVIRCIGTLEGDIKALLHSIQKKRKAQGERINNQADIIYLALQELEEKIR